MTSYTAIPDSDIDADSPVTESLMTLLRDNTIAITEGTSPAPNIQLAAMAANSVDTSQLVAAAVGRSEIANSTTTSAGSINDTVTVAISLNDWALFPMVHGTNSSNVRGIKMIAHITDGSSASSPRFSLFNESGGNESYDVDHRWIIAA